MLVLETIRLAMPHVRRFGVLQLQTLTSPGKFEQQNPCECESPGKWCAPHTAHSIARMTSQERYSQHAQLEHLQSKYVGTGHADTTK